VKVCPVEATWQEPDGITVIDYDWCIGCRYCEAACPYWARRFNFAEPQVPDAELNPNMAYLSNRPRDKGVMEKCTFCLQRTRVGRLPACLEVCPTGSRKFGNVLDPNSEVAYILAHKRVYVFKEDVGTIPRFFYYFDERGSRYREPLAPKSSPVAPSSPVAATGAEHGGLRSCAFQTEVAEIARFRVPTGLSSGRRTARILANSATRNFEDGGDA
jgi:Fe-S-cluster-containing dehydrogenase component